MRYINKINTSTPTVSGTWVNYGKEGSSKEDTNNCKTETTFGELMLDGSAMRYQLSCEPHAYNAGNYYNLPSQLGDAKYNDVCPKGWSLPDNNGKTSYSNLLIAYGIDNSASKVSNTFDAALINLPLSFLRSGRYVSNGSLYGQGNDGVYRMASLLLYFYSGGLDPADGTYASYGYSVRCVGR